MYHKEGQCMSWVLQASRAQMLDACKNRVRKSKQLLDHFLSTTVKCRSLVFLTNIENSRAKLFKNFRGMAPNLSLISCAIHKWLLNAIISCNPTYFKWCFEIIAVKKQKYTVSVQRLHGQAGRLPQNLQGWKPYAPEDIRIPKMKVIGLETWECCLASPKYVLGYQSEMRSATKYHTWFLERSGEELFLFTNQKEIQLKFRIPNEIQIVVQQQFQ